MCLLVTSVIVRSDRYWLAQFKKIKLIIITPESPDVSFIFTSKEAWEMENPPIEQPFHEYSVYMHEFYIICKSFSLACLFIKKKKNLGKTFSNLEMRIMCMYQ